MKLACAAILLWALVSCSSEIRYPEGGYDFLKSIKPDDSGFYFLPIKDSFSQSDSILFVRYENEWLKKFNEPNLSLSPLNEPTFRLFYEPCFHKLILVTLKPTEIVIKTEVKGIVDMPTDESHLSDLEKADLNFIENHSPFKDWSARKRMQHYIDSITKQNPKLRDPKYYMYLLKKISIDTIPVQYSTKRIKIKPEEFEDIVSDINLSGFWNSPLRIECTNFPADGDGYIFEANTPQKYKCVISGDCENQSQLPFAKACQKLVDKAGLSQKIHVYWDGHIDSTSKNDTDILVVQDVNLEPPSKHKKKKH